MINKLNTQNFGEITDQPIMLIVHGLFGSGRNWRAIAKRLSADRHVITVDMRNHGDSFWNDSHTYHDLADDLEQTLSQINGPVDLLGHSMGGKAAMMLALRNPSNLNRLIVADIAPVPYLHSQISNVEIMKSIDIASITRRSEAEKALFTSIPDPATCAFFAQSIEFSDVGNRWKLNLDTLAANMDHIVGFPKVSGVFSGQTLFIKGAKSDYVLPSHMSNIKQLFPNANLHEIEQAGHWIHAEAPREFIATVANFINE